jgi:hypothetical protein
MTLAHYRAFQDCPSLPILKKRFADEMPDYVRYGIHVMVSQNGLGELTLGDSHEYGAEIASRWNGVYVKHPTEPYFVARPVAGVTIVTGVGGAGMTLSFGLAEKIVKENLGED